MSDAPPAEDPRFVAIDKIRDVARWLILAFAAIGAVLVGSAPLANLGKFDVGDWRLWVAAGAASIALGGVALAIWETVQVLLPISRGLNKIVTDKTVRKIFDANYELLDGHGRSLEQFKREYDDARDAWMQAVSHREENPGDPHAVPNERNASARFDAFADPVDRVVREGILVAVRRRFRWAQVKMFFGALVAGLAIVAFTWASNPPSATTKPAPTLVLGVDPMGRGAVISRSDAAHLLRTHGIAPGRVPSYLLSFAGPISIETLPVRMKLFRYSARKSDAGRYLTDVRFPTAALAQSALHLPWANTAACRQRVRVTHRTFVLVGAVAFGKPAVRQYLILEPKAFDFGTGNGFSTRPCRE